MRPLASRQVPNPDPGLDPPSPEQDANAMIEMNNLHRSTSATSDITNHIPESLGQLPVASSMASREMTETSTPEPAVAMAQTQPPVTETSEPLAEVEQVPGDSTTVTSDEKGKETASAASPPLSRIDSIAIGPAVDETHTLANTLSPGTDVANPVCNIMLLLTSGARHGYRVDERYLSKRQTTIPGVTETGRKDPYSISVFTLKELILKEWREEWDAKPSSPSSIRLIYFGRLLNDNVSLKECRFNETATNVVHMTVRPQDIVDEEETERKRAEARQHDGAEPTPGCGRCVIL